LRVEHVFQKKKARKKKTSEDMEIRKGVRGKWKVAVRVQEKRGDGMEVRSEKGGHQLGGKLGQSDKESDIKGL